MLGISYSLTLLISAQLMLWDHLQHDLPQDYPSSSIFDARQQQHKWQEVVETAQIFSPSAADGSSTTTAMTPFLLHAMHLMAEGLQRRVTQLLEETEGCKRRLRVLREIIMSECETQHEGRVCCLLCIF